MIQYNVLLLLQTYDPQRTTRLPVLNCQDWIACEGPRFPETAFKGTFKQLAVGHLKAQIFACRCRFQLERVTCSPRWYHDNIYTRTKIEDREGSSHTCSELSQIAGCTGGLVMINGGTKCKLITDTTTITETVTITKELSDYDPRQILFARFKSTMPSKNPFVSQMTNKEIIFSAENRLIHSGILTIKTSPATDIKFLKTESTCEIILAETDDWFFTGETVYTKETNEERLLEQIPDILLFDPDNILQANLYEKAIALFLRSTSRDIQRLCERSPEDPCRGISKENNIPNLIQRKITEGIALSIQENRSVLASQCHIMTKRVNHTRFIVHDLNIRHNYTIIKTALPANDVIQSANRKGIVYPDSLFLDHDGTLVVYSQDNLTNENFRQMVRSFNISDSERTKTIESLILETHQTKDFTGKVRQGFRTIGKQIKETINKALIVTGVFVLIGAVIMKITCSLK